MRLIAFHRPSFAVIVAFAIGAIANSATAQKPKVLAPHDPIAPEAKSRIPVAPVPRTTAAGPWIVDSHFQSTIFLKNIVHTSTITVTPVLHFSDGSEHKLAAVQLEPSGTTKIDINAGLDALGISPNATLTGWVELQYNWAWDPICGMIRVVDTSRSVVFTFAFGSPESLSPESKHKQDLQVTAGMWWKQESNVTGFITLANTTSRPITSKVEVSDNHAAILGTHTITVAPQGMETLDLLEMQSSSATAGGIRVSYTGEQDALLINGGLEDVGVGYSANIPFAAPPHAAPPLATAAVPQGIVELGLMTGASDPWMHFPSGTTFTIYSVLRNATSAPISISPTLWWTENGSPTSFDLPQFTLAPFETRTLDPHTMLAAAGLTNFSGSVNLDFDTQGQTGLLLASGAVDQTFNYVFPVVARGIGPSASKSLSYWSTGNGDDTMVTMWNPADEQQSFIFRLFFAGGHYDRLIDLGPRATYMFDVSEIMSAPGPDLDGNVIPPGTQEGSAEIVGIEADNQSIMVAVDSSIYNVKKATCNGNCVSCNGATAWSVSASPFGAAVGGQQQEALYAQYCNGLNYSLTSSSLWSTSNTNVATVNSGLVNGVSPGTITLYATNSNAPICAPQCNGSGLCPAYTGGGASAPGTVAKLSCTSPVARGQSTACTISGPSGLSISGWTFTDGGGTQVTSNSTKSTWSGMMVTSGIVTVTAGGAPLSSAIAVIGRPNFAFTAVSPTSKNNPFNGDGCSISVASPPVKTGEAVGEFCLGLPFTVYTATVADSGPNNGYSYVLSVSSTSGALTSGFFYVISPDLQDTSSTFYQAQCGNYNAQTDPNGFVSGANLLADTTRHEAGSVQSHYENYVVAQNSPSNNLGTAAEGMVGYESYSALASSAATILNQNAQTIISAAQVEPCNTSNVAYNASCVFQGNVNFQPYASCK